MKKTVWGFGLVFAVFFGMAWHSDRARAEDTVVVGQPYYYGSYGYGGFYGAPFFPGSYANNPVFQPGAIGSNPYFLTNLQRRAGAISRGQARQGLRQFNTILYAPVPGNPNVFDGPYVNYNGGVYAY